MIISLSNFQEISIERFRKEKNIPIITPGIEKGMAGQRRKMHKKVGHFPQGNVSYKKGEMRMLLCSILISPNS